MPSNAPQIKISQYHTPNKLKVTSNHKEDNGVYQDLGEPRADSVKGPLSSTKKTKALTTYQDDLEQIIKLLSVLGYNGIETWESSWINSVLINSGTPRYNLMIWVVEQFLPDNIADLQQAPQKTHYKYMLESLSSIGICKADDLDLIEGKVHPSKQLKFWRGCMECMNEHRLKKQNRHRHKNKYNSLLDDLAHSSHPNLILKDSNVANIIPGDLKAKYKAYRKQSKATHAHNMGYISDELKEVNNSLEKLQEDYRLTEKSWRTSLLTTSDGSDSLEDSNNLFSILSGLNKQQDLFQEVYDANIASWIPSTTQIELSTTGPLVEEATTKLLNLTQTLKMVEKESQRCDEIADQEKQVSKNMTNPSTIMSTLQSIVIDESNSNTNK